MKVLITGINGFIGRHLASSLRQAAAQDDKPLQVCGSMRSSAELPAGVIADALTVTGDLSGSFDWRTALDECSQVIHTAGAAHNKAADSDLYEINCAATVNLARQAAAAGVRRFIFISSIAVYGRRTSTEPLTELTPAQPDTAYGKSKWAAEQALQDIACRTTMEIVIIRPALTYGWDAPANINKLLRLSASSWPLPFARVHNRRHFLAIENLCGFVQHVALHCNPLNLGDHSDVAGGALVAVNLADTDAVSLAAMVTAMRSGMQQSVRLWPVPVGWMRGALWLLRRPQLAEQLFGDLQVSNSKARQVFGWAPALSPTDALRHSAAQYYLRVIKQA